MAVFQGAFYAEVGARIRAARDKAGITQAALARALGVKSRTSVTNIELGRQPIYLHLLVKVAAVLNVAISTLIPEPAPPGKVNFPRKVRALDSAKQEWVERVISGPVVSPSEKTNDH